MRLLFRKFCSDTQGSLAVQISIMMIPILTIIGSGIEYSRISKAEKNLEDTLHIQLGTVSVAELSNRKNMEEYIVSLANLNGPSENLSANISVVEDKIRIDLKDKVKTPLLSIIGKPEVEVMASMDMQQRQIRPNQGISTRNTSQLSNSNQQSDISKAKINQMKRQIMEQIQSVQKSRLPASSKRKILAGLRNGLQRLNKL